MENTLEHKKIAIFVEDLYEDLEAWYPYLRLKEASADVSFVGPEAKTYQSKHGYPLEAKTAINNINAEDFDAMVIPGGYAPDKMRRSNEMIAFVKTMNEEKKPIAAICHGGWMLISADVLRDKKATSFSAIKDDMVNAGAKWEDKEVVRDKNIITSRMPEDLPAFLKQLINAINETEE